MRPTTALPAHNKGGTNSKRAVPSVKGEEEAWRMAEL